MDRILDNEIQNLLDAGIGDSGRLGFIRESLQSDKPLYNTDKKFLYSLLKKHATNESVLERFDYVPLINIESQPILEKPIAKKRIKTKILSIISLTFVSYFLVHIGISRLCYTFVKDKDVCLEIFEWLDFFKIHIRSGSIWGGNDAWYGEVGFIEEHTGLLVLDSLGFFALFVGIPIILITIIVIRNRK